MWKAKPRAITGMGIVPRLTASFLAVAVLAIAANFIADHSESTRTVRVERIVTQVERPVVSIVQAPTRLVRPMPPLPLEDSREYLRVLDVFGQAAWDRAYAVEDPQVHSAYLAAAEKLDSAGARLTRKLLTAAGKPSAKIAEYSSALKVSADALVQQSDARHHYISEYRRHLEILSKNSKTALDGSFRIFGRFIAREYLLKLDADLEKVRERFEESIGVEASPASLQALGSAEDTFAATLAANANSLERVQGKPWLDQTHGEMAGLQVNRTLLEQSHSPYRSERANLIQRKAAAAAYVEEALGAIAAAREADALNTVQVTPVQTSLAPAPAPATATLATPALTTPALTTPVQPTAVQDLPPGAAAPADSAADVTPEEQIIVLPRDGKRDALIARITIGVIGLVLLVSVLTVLSIIRPVRRLMSAAARLAEGDSQVRVPRGGLKEMDDLAASFNRMAEQLAQAQEISRFYQMRLESDVAARTTELKDLAERDPLTQLPNRRHWSSLMNDSLAAAAANGRYVGVFYLDLDNFKTINDSMGHAFGDQLVRMLAQRLNEVSSEFGYAARLGGDEFSVIFKDAASPEQVYEVGERLVRAFHSPLQIEQRELMISVSAGVSVYPIHGSTSDELLSAADAALFRAKSLGRNQFNIYTPDLRDSARETFNVEQRLRRAVERQEFELVFQPEVAVDTRRVSLVEALLRWRQDDGRLAPPAEFLTVAESSGFIADIDDWVLNAALSAASSWYHGAWREARVAINISPRQLLDTRFALRLQDLLRRHELAPGCIEIELTETVLQTGPATIRTLHDLKDIGIDVALDDFGTGYSSLTSLERLPLSRVKLDRSLIAGIGTNQRAQAIATAIMTLCAHLQLQVTAEGVEDGEQLAWLAKFENVFLQGYFIARPLCFAAIEPALAKIHHAMTQHMAPAPAGKRHLRVMGTL